MLRRILALAGAVCLAHVATAQTCTNPGDLFLKNDGLPQIPNQQTVSVIPGLCEGESCGCVFDVSNQAIYSNDVKVNMCAVGFINVASANGITAAVNMRIFDGVTWNPAGTIPTFGPLVFDFENQTGSSIQISSSAINTVDIPSSFNVHVTSGQLVVVFDMEINTGGDCANGYFTNFCTDWTGSGTPCQPKKKNLIYIQGQGWRDPMSATVSGIPLCSFYYAGNWLIRACVTPVGYPQSYCTSKLNSANCFANVGWTGSPTLTSGPDNFHIRCTNVVNNKQGLMFWGSGQVALPFFGGTLCVAQPVTRMPLQNSLGTTGCTGTYDYFFSQAYMAANALSAGDVRYAEFWYRDPSNLDGTFVALSNALAFRINQ